MTRSKVWPAGHTHADGRPVNRDGNHGSGPRAWPIKDCRGTVLG